MPKLYDPDSLNQNVEIAYNTAAKTVSLNIAGWLSSAGVSAQCVYSFSKHERKHDPLLRAQPPIFDAISANQFDLINTWTWGGQSTINLLKDSGYAIKNSSLVSLEEWVNITTQESDSNTTYTAYYQQAAGGVPTNFNQAGVVNQAVKIYGDGAHGNFDYRKYLKLFIREQGKLFSFADVLASEQIASLDYGRYKILLSTGADAHITTTDADISTLALFTGMSIAYGVQSHIIGGVSYTFPAATVDANGGSYQQVYEFHQWYFRQAVATQRTDPVLMKYEGNTLVTENGVFIINAQPDSGESVLFTDGAGLKISPPVTLTVNNVIVGAELRIYDSTNAAANSHGAEIAGVEVAASTVFALEHTGTVKPITIQMIASGYEESIKKVVLGATSQVENLINKVDEFL